MPVKKFRPVTPTLRYKTVNSFDEVSVDKPQKALLRGAVSRTGGRNNQGRMTMRRRGGGHKRRYRVIDFKRNKLGVPGKVASVEYDPNRSSFIALIVYADGDKRYILAPAGLTVGAAVVAGPDALSAWGTRCLYPTFRLVPPYTTSSCSPVPAVNSRVVRELKCSCLVVVKMVVPSCVFPRVK